MNNNKLKTSDGIKNFWPNPLVEDGYQIRSQKKWNYMGKINFENVYMP